MFKLGNPRHDIGGRAVEVISFFSLTERAEQWYTRTIGSMSGDWEELRDDFCYSFSLTECIDSLPTDILDFEQLEEESIGAAWARFLRLLASSPDLSLPDDVSLNIFCSSLDMEFALKLDITAGGSFAQIIPTEGREILDFLLANSSFPTNHNEHIQQECESHQEELPTAEYIRRFSHRTHARHRNIGGRRNSTSKVLC